MSLRRIRIGNPTPRRVIASSVVRLDVPDRREAGVIGGRRAAMVAPSAGVRERQRRRVACPAVAGRRLPGVARRGRSTIRVTKRCVDRTRTPVPAGCWGRSHPSRHQVGPLAAGPGPELAATAQARNVALQFYPVRESKDLDDAFAARSKARAEAPVVLPHPFVWSHTQRIVDLATRSRLPALEMAASGPMPQLV
jgi:hypothetical protein